MSRPDLAVTAISCRIRSTGQVVSAMKPSVGSTVQQRIWLDAKRMQAAHVVAIRFGSNGTEGFDKAAVNEVAFPVGRRWSLINPSRLCSAKIANVLLSRRRVMYRSRQATLRRGEVRDGGRLQGLLDRLGRGRL